MKYEKRKEIVYERLGHEILAFDTLNNMPYVLNSMAALIFSLIENELNPEEIATKLCMDYEVNFKEALSDINEIIDDLVKKEILIPINLSY